MNELIQYLRRIAPKFFAERMRGASDDQIARVEDAAGIRLTDSHREFLAEVGMTPPQALNPFLNDRDFGVPALLRAYEEWRATTEETGATLPDNVAVFSNSDILGEYIYLHHQPQLHQDPVVGDIRFETGEFVPKPEIHLLGFLQWWAFQFRLEQESHMLELVPYWDAEKRRFDGDSDTTWELLMKLGLQPVFSLESGSRCADNGTLAAIVHVGGSGLIAANELTDLRRAEIMLHRHVDIQFAQVPEAHRRRAPRE